MSIIINLDVVMAKRKKGLTELANEVDITLANLSILIVSQVKSLNMWLMMRIKRLQNRRELSL